MSVKAKFFVSNVGISAINEDGSARVGSVRLGPVTRGAANKRWAAYTPAGSFEMTINGSALAYFQARVGKEMAITIEDAGDDPATHDFVALEDEFQADGYREESCAECGHAREAHAQA